MSIYQRKIAPPRVNAVRWTDNGQDQARFLGWLDASGIRIGMSESGYRLFLPDVSEPIAIESGDWLVRSAEPYVYFVMTDEEFQGEYEAIDG